MNSSFEKYIKAAMDSHQYSVVCEMANVIYPEKNKINMMTYPGKDVRIYKNREDEVQILCPNDISITQESNITKAISTGTIFEDADEVDKYAGFIVKTKMPIDAMTNKGLENPYKIREMVGSTIGVMNEDGDVDVSDTDLDNGNNVIDDLLKKGSKEFKDVKNVVDDYLGNDSHEFGYDKDFTADIQQLRDEINNFKDADISPEDSITDDDWNDDWGSATSIMGDHNDAEDERDSDDEPSKAEDNLDVADDDDEDEKNEDDELTQESYSINPPAYKLRPNQTASFLDADDDITNDTDISYNAKSESTVGEMNENPSDGDNVNITMEEDTTTPAPVFSSGPATQTESDEPTEEKDSEKKDEDSDSKEPVAESTKVKEVIPGDLNAAPADGHNPLLDPIHEGFMLKKPKKLKAIDVRSIVSYVTIEMNDIKDANDQAMLAGYVCSKLELIDFYLTVIDTNDERYVVPHTRQYLVDGQKQLSDLLTKILRIRPINRAQRIWQIEKLI